MYQFFLSLLLILMFALTACADVIAGPMIVMIAGIYFVLPLLLVALVVLITLRLIRKLKQKHKEEEKP